MRSIHALTLFFGGLFLSTASAQTTPDAGPSAENARRAAQQIAGFRFDKKRLTVRLFAHTAHVQDPTAICLDDHNRLYVAESHRWRRGGVDDNRQRQFWFLDDISSRTTADRLRMYEKWKSKYPLDHYTKYSERIIRLEDRDADGAADHRVVYAEDFDDPLDGPAIGLIARENKVYLTCIPHLWMLEDEDGDGVADARRSLQNGFGVRVSLSGHDMHGLVWGPDGKLYWSIGDRGYNIETKEGRRFAAPSSGAVFRCNPDGSDVEVYFEGLRNPQELAFDQFGNLFTVDNNADLGDKARVVYLLEGGTAGWHSGYQNLTTFRKASGIAERDNLVAWMVEKPWTTGHDGRPAYVLPPLPGFEIDGRIKVSGPSGLVFHSTPVMGDALANAFYVCDFRGRANRSGIFTFKVENAGAGFKVIEHAEFLGGVGTPDIDFSYDGKMYIADWFGGWTGNDQGNIYTVCDDSRIDAPYVRQTVELFAAGFREQTTAKLTELLAHVDMRVRLRAQYELARRGHEGHTALLATARSHTDLLARLHGIWGTGQAGRNDERRLAELVPLAEDPHPEIRANALKVLGEARYRPALDVMVARLEDPNPRVRSMAATALGKLKSESTLEPLLAMLIANEDEFIRHAAVYAIAKIAEIDVRDFVYRNLNHESKAVRLAMLLVLRRWRDPRLGELLDDRERFLTEAAARAIYDLDLAAAMPRLARRLESLTGDHSPMTHLRAVHANFRLGTTSHARRLLSYCLKPLARHHRVQVEAMHLLGAWGSPPKVDRVVGQIRPHREPRDEIADVVRAELPKLLSTVSGTVAAKAVDLAAQYNVKLNANVLVSAVLNTGLQTDFRVSSIQKLTTDHPEQLTRHLETLLRDELPAIRSAALNALLEIDAAKGLAQIVTFLDSENASDQQIGYANLGDTRSEEIDKRLVVRLKELVAGEGAKESQLELVEASERSKTPAVTAALATYRKKIADDPLASFRIALRGGDAARGRDVFQNHGIAQCVRCHRLDRRASTGPGLREVGKKDREYLLRSTITPSSEIAQGFGTVMIETKDGKELVGVITKTDEDVLTIKTEQETHRIKKSDIEFQSEPVSAMVPMAGILTKREVRDVIEFLKTLTP